MGRRFMYGALVALVATAAAAAFTSDRAVVTPAPTDERRATVDTAETPVQEQPGTTMSALAAPPTPPTTPRSSVPATTRSEPAASVSIDSRSSAEDWRLVWADEFDSFDTTKWRIEQSTYGHGNGELQCYQPSNVVVEEGMLRLVAEREATICPRDQRRDYTSGMVRTEGLADWTYGRFEVRARLPGGAGFWPAAWLSPTDSSYGTWPRSGELDIVESLGSRNDRIVGSLHWMGRRGRELSNREFFLPAGERFADGFHTFAVEWEPHHIAWYVDDVEYHRVTTWTSAVGDRPAPFDQPFYLKLNLAVGGGAAVGPTGVTPFPASYDVDWVRVYQH